MVANPSLKTYMTSAGWPMS